MMKAVVDGFERMTNTVKKNFDKEAGAWDENPVRVKLAKDIFAAISQQIGLTPQMDIMDFGCGTGLITILFQPHVRSITGIDSSRGMLDQFDRKIAGLGHRNIHTVLVDLDRGDRLSGKYDLVICNMTLHHIKQIKPLFEQFYGVMVPGGRLSIADLDPDGGRFHGDNTGVFHFGFDRTAVCGILTETGFDNVRPTDAAAVIKTGPHGEEQRFSVFLITAQKKSW